MENEKEVKEEKEENGNTKLPLILEKGETADIETIINNVGKQVDLINKVKTLALKLTTKDDWINENGQPYLMWRGTSKIRQIFGIDIKDKKVKIDEYKDELGIYKIVTIIGKGVFRGIEVDALGVCSTRDKFFGKEQDRVKDIEEVDISNIIRKAETNFNQRLLKSILGLHFTWADLELVGIEMSKTASVTYKKTITEDDVKKQDELQKMLNDYFGTDNEAISHYLVTISAFKSKDGKDVAGLDSVKKLSGKRLEYTYAKIVKDLTKN